MAEPPYHRLDTDSCNTGNFHGHGEDTDWLNNNHCRKRIRGVLLENNYKATQGKTSQEFSHSSSSKFSTLLPHECRLLLLCHEFLILRSQKHITEARKYINPSCTFSILPHYNLHLVTNNLSSMKAFLTPCPSHVLCEFGGTYSERIYFQVEPQIVSTLS